MVKDNLALNKKGDKVKIVGKERHYNLLGTTIQYVPVLTYLLVKFDMFTFDNVSNGITGWGFVGLGIIFLAFRSKIKEKLKEYDETFGETWKRAKTGSLSLVMATVLFMVYIFSLNFFLIFGIFSVSTFASLYFYTPYDTLTVKKKKLQKILTEENDTKTFENIKKDFEDMKTL